MMSGSRCSPPSNRVTAQVGDEPANPDIHAAMGSMAMPDYAALIQPTPSAPAFYAWCV